MSRADEYDGHVNTLIVGIGNEYRNDDVAGMYTARLLNGLKLPRTHVRELHYDISELLHVWMSYRSVIIIDAVSSGAKPGSIHRFNLAQGQPTEADVLRTSHSIGFSKLIELSRTINRIPEQIVLYGIEGKNFDHGITLSKEVATGAKKLAREIARMVKKSDFQLYITSEAE
jgi:hydrogenase maturation protease